MLLTYRELGFLNGLFNKKNKNDVLVLSLVLFLLKLSADMMCLMTFRFNLSDNVISWLRHDKQNPLYDIYETMI